MDRLRRFGAWLLEAVPDFIGDLVDAILGGDDW